VVEGTHYFHTLPAIISCLIVSLARAFLSCRLDELETSFKSLKITSDESGAFVAQVRSSMADLKQERKEAADCLKSTFPPFRILIPTMAKKILHVFELVLT